MSNLKDKVRLYRCFGWLYYRCRTFLSNDFEIFFASLRWTFCYSDVNTSQGLRADYLQLGWFPEDTLVCTEALVSLWGGISISNALYRAQRLKELSMLTQVTR